MANITQLEEQKFKKYHYFSARLHNVSVSLRNIFFHFFAVLTCRLYTLFNCYVLYPFIFCCFIKI